MPGSNLIIMHDLTLPLSPTTLTYPGDPKPSIRRIMDLSQGDSVTASHISINCHVGTHVDAPAHFIAEGATLEELPMESFYGPAAVISLEGKTVIEISDLTSHDLPTSFHIILKTDNSMLLQRTEFSPTRCVLSPEAAKYLITKMPRSIGFDYYSLDPPHPPGVFPSHTILAQGNIPTFVCLNLAGVESGRFYFSGFPLRLSGTEASPVRAILLNQK